MQAGEKHQKKWESSPFCAVGIGESLTRGERDQPAAAQPTREAVRGGKPVSPPCLPSGPGVSLEKRGPAGGCAGPARPANAPGPPLAAH